ncbi:OLC1v1031002C1 [Oldenlandia corymbosa var. corymbosa]|uniref:OLC1v1031002C1 n=1 Tax=Oldenlandia corymbosa var. corymbosa TaxID=529605 RepID=A0AAV1CIG2_OLDCO|nr:OLC1v1031002C1 [Oldenlandia corymbosa var. corymbosa]
MRRRSAKRKTSEADTPIKPEPVKTEASPGTGSPNKSGADSPNEFDFDFEIKKLRSSSSASAKKKTDGVSGGGGLPSASKFMPRSGGLSTITGVNTIADLKDFASSELQSIKQQLERSHSEIMKDMDASQSRLQKRFKMQSQGGQQVMDEAEREFKEICDSIGNSQDAMKADFTKFMKEAQSSAARLSKTTLPEIFQSFESSISSLRSRYGISSTAAC